MVTAIVKPKVFTPTPASNVEFLRFVRRVIESERERFICNAIERVSRVVGSKKQAVEYLVEARRACGQYAYYSLWVRHNKPELMEGENWKVACRLALIDEWIAEAQNG